MDDILDSSLNFTSSDVIPDTSRDALEGIQESVVDSINFTNFRELLNESIITFDTEDLVTNLTMVAYFFGSNSTVNDVVYANTNRYNHLSD